MSAFQNPGVLDISRPLPAAGLGQLIDTDVAHGPIREDPELPLQRRSRADCQQAVKIAVGCKRAVKSPDFAARLMAASSLVASRCVFRAKRRHRHRQHQRFQHDATGVMFIEPVRVEPSDTGPLVGSGAGVTILRAADEVAARSIAVEDPFVRARLRIFEITRWRLNEGALTIRLSLVTGTYKWS